MRLEEFLQCFEGVNGSNGQYMARCPAHEDRNASLSIGSGRDGRILLHCQAGCDNEMILSKIGLKTGDLFPDSENPKRKSQAASNEKWKFVAEYLYPNGAYKNKKIRYIKPDGKKTFVWRHYERGQWEKGKRGFIPLYNAQSIPLSDLIYLVEGEKDVETLKKAGKCAVCSPHGAGRDKWLPEYTAALRGKNVVVIQDNDSIGKEFAEIVCNALAGQAASVKRVDLSAIWEQIPEHGDITDYIEHVKDQKKAMENLDHLTCSLPEYQKQDIGQSEQVNDEKPNFFENGSFRHNLMADYLIEKYSVCKINNALHIYDGGIYKRGENILHGRMIEIYPQIKDAQRREVYKYMNVSLKTPVKRVSSPNLIPFATKIYNIDTGEFYNYSPEYVFLNRFPYDYNPNAPEESAITETIRAISDDDPQIEQLLYEAIGNCFYLLNSFRGSIMLYGNGKNGKSTLLNMILQVVGEENTSKLSLQNLSERFMLAEVYGKAANIGDDIPDSFIPDTSIFKKVATGEYIQAEHKGQDPFSFAPYAKMFFSMNTLPPVGDKSAGFFSRVLLIPLRRTFEQGKGANVGLKFKRWSTQEMEYLVKLSMDGLKRLLQNGDFTIPETVKEALHEYELENNPVKEFLSERNSSERPIKLPFPIAELYYNYQTWCAQTGHKSQLTRGRFTREVCKITGWSSNSARHKYFGNNTGRCFCETTSHINVTISN